MAKMSIIGDPFKDLAYRIDEMGGDLKSAVNEALEETQLAIQLHVETAAGKYTPGGGRKGYATGKMLGSVVDVGNVKWRGDVAEVDSGFDLLKEGGYHSIFMMYGTPRIAKDARLYNAIRGAKTRSDIEKVQSRIMQKHLDLARG